MYFSQTILTYTQFVGIHRVVDTVYTQCGSVSLKRILGRVYSGSRHSVGTCSAECRRRRVFFVRKAGQNFQPEHGFSFGTKSIKWKPNSIEEPPKLGVPTFFLHPKDRESNRPSQQTYNSLGSTHSIVGGLS